MVWHDDTGGNYDVQYYTCDSLSTSPVVPRNLTGNPGASLDPSIAIAGDSIVVVVWTDDSGSVSPSILFARFFPNADTMLDYGVVNTGARMCSNPCVAVGRDSSVHVVWSENTAEMSDVLYRKWRGDWLGDPLNLSVSLSTSVNASVVVDGSGNVHVAWADNVLGYYEIFYRKYTDGLGWGARYQVSTSGSLAWSPSMGADEQGNAYVIWSDRRHGNFEIYFRRFLAGIGWASQKRITYNPAISANPSLAVDCAGNLYIVWEDFRDGNDEIYYRRITNSDGPGWDPIETRLTTQGATSWDASVAADSSGNVHVLWADSRDGNFEIYYKLGVNPIPVNVEVLSFQAACTAEGILLTWSLASDAPAAFVDVFRSTSFEGDREKLTEISLLGESEYMDAAVVDGEEYFYFLGIWDGASDEHAFFGPLGVRFQRPYALVSPAMRVWPNPATGAFNVEFAAEKRGLPYRLLLLDVGGRAIRTIASGCTPEGLSHVPCEVAGGRAGGLAPGVYVVSLEVGSTRLEKKLVVLK
ncbi:MAG: hypothetical protein JSW03_10215 [Candidatus Eiseniibacteriota bacterium]|nr:MAG: hypothetical protein JSW03_10215 [Candidatus Eisenbacteria bacterium]